MSKYQIPPRVKARLKAQGALIRAARQDRGFTQADLSERTGTSRPTINRVESGNPNVAWGTVMTICWLLDIPSDPDLMDPARRATLLASNRDVRRTRSKQRLDDDF